ncbi:hypothetical protein RI367_003055 [Sorochytrium milnesiophthora]
MASCYGWPTDCAGHKTSFPVVDDAGDDFVLCYANGTNAIFYRAACSGMQGPTPKTYMPIDASGVNTDSAYGTTPVTIDKAVLVTQPSLALDLCDTAHLDQDIQDAHIYAGSIFSCVFQREPLTAHLSLGDNSFMVAEGMAGLDSHSVGVRMELDSPLGVQWDLHGVTGDDVQQTAQVAASGTSIGASVSMYVSLTPNATQPWGCLWNVLGTFIAGPRTVVPMNPFRIMAWISGGGAFPHWPGKLCAATKLDHNSTTSSSWNMSSSVALGWDGKKNLTQFDVRSGRLGLHTPTSNGSAISTAIPEPQQAGRSATVGIAVGASAAALILIAVGILFARRRASNRHAASEQLEKTSAPAESYHALEVGHRPSSLETASNHDLILSTLPRPNLKNVHHLSGKEETIILPDAPHTSQETIYLHVPTISRLENKVDPQE